MNAEHIKAVVAREDFKRLRARAQVALFLMLTHTDGTRKLAIKDIATKAGMSYRNAQRAVDEVRSSPLSHIGP